MRPAMTRRTSRRVRPVGPSSSPMACALALDGVVDFSAEAEARVLESC